MHYRLIILFITCQLTAVSQSVPRQVISPAGDHFTSANADLCWTLGEVAILTISDGNNTLTQGFQQTNLEITSVDEVAFDFEISLYPVPCTDYLDIQLDGLNDDLTVRLFNLSGQLMQTMYIPARMSQTRMFMAEYAAGTYFLEVQNPKALAKTYKLIKTN